jgi:hypothetical protein
MKKFINELDRLDVLGYAIMLVLSPVLFFFFGIQWLIPSLVSAAVIFIISICQEKQNGEAVNTERRDT